MTTNENRRLILCVVSFCVVSLFTFMMRADAELSQEPAQNLSRQAYGILKKSCFACHGADKTSGLDLRTEEGVRAGGESGPVIVPYDTRRSRLYQFVTHEQKPVMPPNKMIPDAEIDVLRRWIEAGAPLDGFEKVVAGAPEENREKRNAEMAASEDRPITPEERRYWAFQHPRRVAPPRVPDTDLGADWGKNPVDSFLLAAMKAKGLKPSPPADRRTLIRRAYLDLLGLPPSPEEVEAFVKESAPDAWERLVDRLLASPHYGERWARHWLDLVRFADSGGFEFDVDRPDAWRYRDYVVNSFNADKPYNQFVREQLAGDEYAPESQEAMIATGFLRLAAEETSAGSGGERARQDLLDDVITTSSLTFMGLTVGCARCHDHKFDPIPQKDYYRIQAVFYSTKPVSYPLVGSDVLAAHKQEVQRIEGLQKPLRKAKAVLEAPYLKVLQEEVVSRLPEYLQIAWRTPEEKRSAGQRLNVRQIEKTLRVDSPTMKITEKDVLARMTEEDKAKRRALEAQIEELDEQKPKPYPTARAIGEDSRQAIPSYFLRRGSIDAKGSLMAPGVLSAVGETEYAFPAPPPNAKSTWRRRGFAEWLISPQNPLTARVMVNRIWQHHFGEGIVRTPSNFGKMGEPPSHPELLDWLALEFIERGWSMKQMHRLMMTSQAYRMSSNDIAANVALDPENRLFWRMPRVRLEAEIIRDEVMAVAGNLDRTVGGPAVFPYIDPKLFQSSTKRTWPGKPDDDPSTWRRSIYVYSKRSIRYPLFETFDQPNLINSCERRNRSTIAPQALLLMNNNFILLQAKKFAERLRHEAGDDAGAQADLAYRLALARPPTDFERAKSIEFIRSSPGGLSEFCHVLFNLNEFVYQL